LCSAGDIEDVRAGTGSRQWPESDLRRPKGGTPHFGVAERCDCEDVGEMLRCEAGITPSRTDMTDLYRPTGEDGECERRAQYLPSTFTVSSIDLKKWYHTVNDDAVNAIRY
jgi:hypothetical protein